MVEHHNPTQDQDVIITAYDTDDSGVVISKGRRCKVKCGDNEVILDRELLEVCMRFMEAEGFGPSSRHHSYTIGRKLPWPSDFPH